MKTVSEHANNIVNRQPTESSISTSTSTASAPSLERKWVAAIFKRFGAEYGHIWTSQLPTQAIADQKLEAWARRLADLTPDEIKTGLSKLPGKPPSAPEFRALCVVDRPLNQSHKRFEKALPAPRNPVLAEEHLEKIREMLK